MALRKSLPFATLGLCLLFSPAIYSASSPLQTGTPDDIVTYIDKIVKNRISDKTTVASLIQMLQNQEQEIRLRERAAWALGELRAASATPALMEAAKHKGLLIRSAALDALVRLRTRTAFPTFTEIAENDPILSLRQRATLALGLLQWEKTIPVLVKLSSDPTSEVQGAAALSMAATHSKKNDFSEALKEMAAEDDAYVKKRAQEGLEVVQRKTAAVREQLESEDADVRLFAALYFTTHGGSSDLKVVKKAWDSEAKEEVRFEMERAMSAIKRRAAEAKKAADEAAKKAPAPPQ